MTRVRYMEGGQVRTDGKWLAGFYFNDALARIAAALDRITALVETQTAGKKVKGKALRGRLEMLKLGTFKEPDFILATGSPSSAYRVYSEVNPLKHEPKGLDEGRRATTADAIAAVAEILDVVEKRVTLSGRPVPRP